MLETSGRNKLSDLAQIIIGENYKRVMVFCDTKFNTATLANQLARLGFSVDCLHGDLSQKERNQIMQNFRDGKLAILVATDVAARGIDVSDVDAVINYDVPSENEHYTHRIGRTGRAKKEGVSYLFYVPEEKKRVQELLRLTRNTDLCTPVHFDFNHEHIVWRKSRTAPTGSRSSATSDKIRTPSVSHSLASSLKEGAFGSAAKFYVLPKAPSPRGLSAKQTGGVSLFY